MEIEAYKENEESMPGIEEDLHVLKPVSQDDAGEGLPYGPANWPKPGDNWGWRVGKRVARNGFFLDRYLYLPKRLRKTEASGRKLGFASKLSVERYIQENFPGVDVEAFFASFSWKIPSKAASLTNGNATWSNAHLPSEKYTDVFDSNSDTGGCKARNKMCNSLVEQVENSPLPVMPCDICCAESRFCRDCCCILCCKTVDYTYGGYSFIKCEAVVGEAYICGHIAHIDCALRCYLAGKVGGSIGLDAEYYCRRCDAKTDLVPHVTRLLQTCESIDSRDDIEKILKVGISILHGSRKTSAKGLLNRFQLAVGKLEHETHLEDIWKLEDSSSANSEDISNGGDVALDLVNQQDPLDIIQTDMQNVSVSFNWKTESLKLEEEIDQVLQSLRKSQETEYELAEERLYTQKNYLSNLFQQLEIERSALTRHVSSTDQDDLLSAVFNRVNQIKRELMKLKEMEKVANGFGRTARGILEEHYGMDIEG
ncbi:protein OBERON 1 [Humulus lupulus]|uniref:protein OBERON 1 n=1 Tax=Humulus lupulus TaxID=3486 RepID=UPI002B4009F2|nr:protein OBERON 1 [Humulus lupulus]XP_062108327.1 protein OBERON 1 [Humulus lupulus]XP_062108328.1 protein OBERON 1 [Humulus lupulus]XP_062108329.1 protein OBERON 1 [Humulus lupulus]